MNNSIKITGILLAIFFGSITAQAKDIQPYAGVGIGMFTTDLGFGAKAKNAVGFYINGGADINHYFGAELRIGSVGSKTIDTFVAGSKFKTDIFISYLGKLQYPFTPEAKVYALLGATTVKGSISGPATSNNSSTQTNLSYGAGFSYTVADSINIGIEYMLYAPKVKATSDGITVTTTDIKLSSFAITTSYNF